MMNLEPKSAQKGGVLKSGPEMTAYPLGAGADQAIFSPYITK